MGAQSAEAEAMHETPAAAANAAEPEALPLVVVGAVPMDSVEAARLTAEAAPGEERGGLMGMTPAMMENMSNSNSESGDVALGTSVENRGHPGKFCDQVSDAVLDACLVVDPKTKWFARPRPRATCKKKQQQITCIRRLDLAISESPQPRNICF